MKAEPLQVFGIFDLILDLLGRDRLVACEALDSCPIPGMYGFRDEHRQQSILDLLSDVYAQRVP